MVVFFGTSDRAAASFKKQRQPEQKKLDFIEPGFEAHPPVAWFFSQVAGGESSTYPMAGKRNFSADAKLINGISSQFRHEQIAPYFIFWHKI